jgi:hypothetical protein
MQRSHDRMRDKAARIDVHVTDAPPLSQKKTAGSASGQVWGEEYTER